MSNHNSYSQSQDRCLALINIIKNFDDRESQQLSYRQIMDLIDDLLDINDGLGPDWPSPEAQNMWLLVNAASDFERQEYEKKIGKLIFHPWPPNGLAGWVRHWWMRAHGIIDIPIHKWGKDGLPQCLGPIKKDSILNISKNLFQK